MNPLSKADMQTLTAENVEAVLVDCLFQEGEDRSKAKIVEGIVHTFGLHPERLEKHKTEIAELLSALPDEFHYDKGWSFLNACMTKSGQQWGEHRDVEILLVLGLATGQVALLLPRALWTTLPGGMPYFMVQKLPNETVQK